ncbi:MAG TPA: LacI family DNA-binding transcriptional regulator [Tianweitania sediminis]|jgi:DNA-binding LacI/PurR family transcriptional regulator|nr:LacI family DNA-binding transcriptional regulator [Tianweitania sediminis]
MSDQDGSSAQFVNALQVAKRAGVSRSAVSRAFTPGASIAPETREKVMRAATELGYQVNNLARSLLTNRSRLVGVVATAPELGFRAHLTAALSKALIKRGSVPLIINTGTTEEEINAAQQALFGYRAEATIILSGSPPASFVDLAKRNGQPVIVIGRSEPEVDSVLVDNIVAAQQAARMFVAQGFTRLGLVGSRSATPSILEREQAFCAAAQEHGAMASIVRGVDTDYRGGREAARLLLAQAPLPQAIFCVNDLMAFGVIDHLRSLASRPTPAEPFVVGFDDVPEAAWQAYDLTTFRQDPDAIASAAIKMLDRRQADPFAPPVRARVPAPLILRNSFRPSPDRSESL